MAYLLDSNVFIEAKRRYYGMDFCPGFWKWLDEAHRTGRVFSIERVADELRVGEDKLSDWSAERRESFFLAPDEPMLESLGQIAEWVQGRRYRQAAISAFLEDADYYLTAFAHAHGHTVVTHEVPSNSVRQVKIPDVCIGMTIKYVNTFEMLRREGAKFVLAA